MVWVAAALLALSMSSGGICLSAGVKAVGVAQNLAVSQPGLMVEIVVTRDVVVPAGGLGCHAPVARRLARSWRTVARSAPGSPRPGAARRSEMRAAESLSPRISRVISRPSRSSTDSRTASASPLRVRVIRSCCWRTRRASSDRRAFASDSGTGVAAIVMVRNIACISQILDYLRTGSQALQPLRSRSREADPGNLRLLSRHAAGTLASLAGTGAASARGRLEVAGEAAAAGERVRNAAGLLDPGQVPGSRDHCH